MEKPFYFLMLFGGILSISSYPMNNEDENKGYIGFQRRKVSSSISREDGDIIDEIISSLDWKDKNIKKRDTDYQETDPFTFNGDYFYPNSYSFYYPPSPYFMPDEAEMAAAESVRRDDIPKIPDKPIILVKTKKGNSKKSNIKTTEVRKKNETVIHSTNSSKNDSTKDEGYIGINMKDLTDNFPVNNDEVFEGMEEASLVRNGDGTSDVEERYKGSIDTNGDFYDLSLGREAYLKRALDQKKSVFEVNLSKYFVDFVCGNDC